MAYLLPDLLCHAHSIGAARGPKGVNECSRPHPVEVGGKMNNPNNPDESRSGDENRPYDLMDGATGESLQVIRELEEQRKISADLNMPLDERLEAYEDIFDSQVGDTSLVRARNIERQVGLRQIFLKFEGGNPTGTQKDRIAFAQAMDALRRGFDTITIGQPAAITALRLHWPPHLPV